MTPEIEAKAGKLSRKIKSLKTNIIHLDDLIKSKTAMESEIQLSRNYGISIPTQYNHAITQTVMGFLTVELTKAQKEYEELG